MAQWPEVQINERIIILTEGSSDRVILQKSLFALYPHLYDYFSFMDFGAANVSGGASSLVSNVKAFSSARIRNRIVAVFDNDTAATDALRGLSGIRLPLNIKVVRLPTLELAKSYPTIGPQGEVCVNVNGLACSIELYLGTDILKDQEGGLMPIQWKGYNQTLKQYQGEILNKEKIQDAYNHFLSEAFKSREVYLNHDWAPMKLVFQTIFGTLNG